MSAEMEQIKGLVRGWAEEARELAKLKAELSVWLMKRRGIMADAVMTDGDKAVEVLLLECALRDRVTVLLGEEETRPTEDTENTEGEAL
jgi:uncharacterized Rossmann fold enzyme